MSNLGMSYNTYRSGSAGIPLPVVERVASSNLQKQQDCWSWLRFPNSEPNLSLGCTSIVPAEYCGVLRPEISVLLKFHFGFGIWCLSVISSWNVVQFLHSGRAGVWGVIPFKRVS